ncbi:MAG: D-alanyl-D-alanine carboxypeptidase family protein [Rhodocyclaceae bacterium]
MKKIFLSSLLATLIATSNFVISDFSIAQQNSTDSQKTQTQTQSAATNSDFVFPKPVPPTIDAKSWLLIDMNSGQVLSENAADERLEPASLTKLMTAYLTFDAIKQGTLQLNQLINISENAWRTGGSKMFVRVNTQVAVEDLIKGMIVQSGNDACVALAEGIAGNEENFAQMMNNQAKRLGMTASQFKNATGLPNSEHYTTARDLSILTTALINDFPEFYKKYYSIKEFTYNNIKQPNRNRLLWLDESVDGVKTGFTDNAGYCLISSANRDNRRVLSVLLGAKSANGRINESAKLLNWGYVAYDSVQIVPANKVLANLRVWKGEKNEITAKVNQAINLVIPKGYANKVQYNFVPVTGDENNAGEKLVAPIVKGQILGKIVVSIENKTFMEIPVKSDEQIEQGSLWRRFIDSILM